MALYVDVLLCLNFLLDYLLLAGVQLLQGRRLRRGRLALGALLGALGSLLVFLPGGTTGGSRLLLSGGMCLLSEEWRGRAAFLKSWLLLFVLSALAGGLLLLLMEGGSGVLYGGGVVYAPVEPLSLLLTLTGLYGAIRLYGSCFPEGRRTLTCPAKLELLGQSISCTAFLDTGNRLREPFSGWPVVLLERSRFPGNIPEEGLRFIPCRSVQGESLLPALKGERLRLLCDPPRELERFYVAFSDEKLGWGLIAPDP